MYYTWGYDFGNPLRPINPDLPIILIVFKFPHILDLFHYENQWVRRGNEQEMISFEKEQVFTEKNEWFTP